MVSVIENRFHAFKNQKRKKKKEPNLFLTSCSSMFLFFQNKNQFLKSFMFLLGNVWLVLLKTGFMFLRKKIESNLFLFGPVLIFSKQKQVFKQVSCFVTECLVSVIENIFHVLRRICLVSNYFCSKEHKKYKTH